MAGTPVTQNDLDSVKDVPLEEAMAYLEGLERERRGLLKAGVILRAVQRAKIQQADAEREAARLQKQNEEATAALQELLARVVAERTRLDRLVAEVATQRAGMVPHGSRPTRRRSRSSSASSSVGRTPTGPWPSSTARIVNGVRLSRLRRAASTRRSRLYGMS
jgi:hypothetical protein